jgi:hypothetical protein
LENQEERDHYEDLDVGDGIILKWILEKFDGAVWLRIATRKTVTNFLFP